MKKNILSLVLVLALLVPSFGMAAAYTLMHQGYWDWMDYSILGILIGVVALDIPRVLKASKQLKS